MKRNIPADSRKCGGFTLAETLLVCIILLFVTGASATGFPAIRTAYSRVVDTANAQVLLSTTLAVLRSELDLCTDVTTTTTDSGSTIIYYNTKEQQKRRVSLTNELNAPPLLVDVIPSVGISDEVNASKLSSVPLVTKSTATPSLKLRFGADGGFFHDSGSDEITIRNLQVTDRDDYPLASVEEYTIHALNLRPSTP